MPKSDSYPNLASLDGTEEVHSVHSSTDKNFTTSLIPAYVGDQLIGVTVQGYSAVLDATTGTFLVADQSKLDGISDNANNYSHPNHTGDVTSTGDGATVIANDAVTYDKMQNVVANNVILGNNAGAGGVVDELTAAEVLAIINVEAGADVTDSTNVVAALSGATLTGALIGGDQDVSRVNLKDVAEVVYAHGSLTTATNFDCANGNTQSFTAGAAFTLTFTNLAAKGFYFVDCKDLDLYTVTWATVDWGDGGEPSWAGHEMLGFYYDGTTLHGWLCWSKA